jgi:predicted GNAT superfamily acetyltransferase
MMNTQADFVFRHLSSPEDYAACVRLQRITWGQEFTELVPPVILMLTQKVGGIAAGAFADDGHLAGYVYGLTGFRNGAPVHWSHMLAVEPKFEGLGIGRRLKELQRELLLERGIELVSWTFDPLVARNAHLNYNRLGVVATEYIPNMYGTDTGSLLHSGLGTDRFVVEWSLADSHVEEVLSGTPSHLESEITSAPIVNTEESGGNVLPVERDLPNAPVVRIEIPWDIEQIKVESMELGRQWRATTKRACLLYLERGYGVEGFYSEADTKRCFYYLVLRQGEDE